MGSVPGLGGFYLSGRAASRRILEQGEDPNRRGIGWTPLYSACERQHPAVAKLLLERGANPNLDKGDGWRPLHAALVRSNADAELVEILLAHGADPRAKGPKGRTPVTAARELGREDLVAILERPARQRAPRRSTSGRSTARDQQP